MLTDAILSVADGGLGFLPSASDKTLLYVGPSSAGTANTVYPVNSPEGLNALGDGPLVEAARHALDKSGGPILCVPCSKTAGTNSAVAQTGAGPAVTLTGTPNDDYDAKVQVTAAGAIGTSKFKYSLDGGRTYSSDIFTAATYPIPGTGLTLNLAVGTYVLDEVYSFTSVCPSFNIGQMNTALDAAFLSAYGFALVYIVGPAQGSTDTLKATNSAGFAAALQTKLTAKTLERSRFTRGFIEAPKVPDAELMSAYASLNLDRVAVLAGHARIRSSKTARLPLVPCGRAAVAKLGKKPVGADPAEVGETFTGWGLLPESVLELDRDEDTTPGLDAARFTTFRTRPGVSGFFIEKFRLFSSATSDFRYLQHGQVIDLGSRIAKLKFLTLIGAHLTTNDNGTLTEGQACALDDEVDRELRVVLVPTEAQGVRILSDRTNNVLSSETLYFKIGVKPLAYAKFVEATIGFTTQITQEN